MRRLIFALAASVGGGFFACAAFSFLYYLRGAFGPAGPAGFWRHLADLFLFFTALQGAVLLVFLVFPGRKSSLKTLLLAPAVCLAAVFWSLAEKNVRLPARAFSPPDLLVLLLPVTVAALFGGLLLQEEEKGRE